MQLGIAVEKRVIKMGPMQRSSLVIVVLLFIAATLVSAVLFTQSFAQRFGGLGILIGQVALATAATVLLRRKLWLSLGILLVVIVIPTAWICVSTNLPPLNVALAFIAVALTTAAWCGGLRLFGWRIVVNTPPSSHLEPQQDRSGQFSLATLLLVTSVVALFIGLLQASGLTWRDGRFHILAGTLTIPACALITLTARSRWGWAPSAILVPLAFAALHLVGDSIFGSGAAVAVIALVCELTFVVGVLVVLRVADICLMRQPRTQQFEPSVRLRSGPQSLA